MKKDSSLIIGEQFNLFSGTMNPIIRNIKTTICLERGAVINIGDNVGVSGSCVWSHLAITIGNNVKIGGDCLIIDSDCHALNYCVRSSEYDQTEKTNIPIIIEDDVLIGTRSIILKGVTIGARSVIGAGSVVVNSIPADCIAAGNPCRVLRYVDNTKDR